MYRAAFASPLGLGLIGRTHAAVSRRSVQPRRSVVRAVVGLPEIMVSANPGAIDAVAKSFGTLGLPAWAVEYGHPVMMGFMVLGMGVPGALFGWQGRLNADKKKGVGQKRLHENVMIAFGLLAFLGGTGGILSTAMQGYDILTTPHALSAGVVLALLTGNAALAYSGFSVGDSSPKGRLKGRTVHAYLGAATMTAFAIHAALGIRILLG